MFRYLSRQSPADFSGEGTPPPLLTIDGLTVGYERAGTRTTVLDGVSLTVEDGVLAVSASCGDVPWGLTCVSP